MKKIAALFLLISATVAHSDIIGNQIDLTIIGNNHLVDIIQSGLGNHKATITLKNDGGSFDFILHQDSDFDKTYEINGLCANIEGCILSIYQ
jgi:hypothetical protein